VSDYLAAEEPLERIRTGAWGQRDVDALFKERWQRPEWQECLTLLAGQIADRWPERALFALQGLLRGEDLTEIVDMQFANVCVRVRGLAETENLAREPLRTFALRLVRPLLDQLEEAVRALLPEKTMDHVEVGLRRVARRVEHDGRPGVRRLEHRRRLGDHAEELVEEHRPAPQGALRQIAIYPGVASQIELRALRSARRAYRHARSVKPAGSSPAWRPRCPTPPLGELLRREGFLSEGALRALLRRLGGGDPRRRG
jgi:hypothetical protein